MMKRRLVGKQIFGDTDVISHSAVTFVRLKYLQNTIRKASLVRPSMEPSSVLLRGPLQLPFGVFGSFYTCEDTNFGVADKVYDDHGPTWVRRNRIVKLGCERTKSRETGPRDRWEIMMFVVISHLIGNS